MKTLDLKVINNHAPYKVILTEDGYEFDTEHGILTSFKIPIRHIIIWKFPIKNLSLQAKWSLTIEKPKWHDKRQDKQQGNYGKEKENTQAHDGREKGHQCRHRATKQEHESFCGIQGRGMG